jgi:hypothetical protein
MYLKIFNSSQHVSVKLMLNKLQNIAEIYDKKHTNAWKYI